MDAILQTTSSNAFIQWRLPCILMKKIYPGDYSYMYNRQKNSTASSNGFPPVVWTSDGLLYWRIILYASLGHSEMISIVLELILIQKTMKLCITLISVCKTLLAYCADHCGSTAAPGECKTSKRLSHWKRTRLLCIHIKYYRKRGRNISHNFNTHQYKIPVCVRLTMLDICYFCVLNFSDRILYKRQTAHATECNICPP